MGISVNKINNSTIYRFMSFESFVDMVQRKSLTFVHHDNWEDPYEGFLFKSIKHEDGKKEILRILKDMTPDNAMPHFGTLLFFENTIFGQSWTECSESDALWRIYSHNKMSIRVEIEIINVLKLLEKSERVTLQRIKYSDGITIESQLEQIVKGNTIDIGNILLTKRTAFAHEQEIRLLLIDLEYLPNDSTFPPETLKVLYEKGDITKEQFETGMENISSKKEMPKIKYIKFGHIKNFIRSVMIHPQSPDWFEETVKEFCNKNYNTTYHGKSKLYHFNYDGPQPLT